MAYKEALVGFIIAGIVATFVPDTFWNDVFVAEEVGSPSFLTVLQHALIAPLLAFLCRLAGKFHRTLRSCNNTTTLNVTVH